MPRVETVKQGAFVFLGGGLGATLRFAVVKLYTSLAPGNSFPWATMSINVLGSLLIGLLLGLATKNQWSPTIQLFVAAGILGGFTTFSAFSRETMILLQAGQNIQAAAYACLSPVLGLSACFLGAKLAAG